MKAFHFSLEQVMRWRASQVDVEKSQFSSAVARVNAVSSAIALLTSELESGALTRTNGVSGAELALWDAYDARTRRQLAAMQVQRLEAETAASACRQALVEADRRLKLLQNLKKNQHNRWMTDWNRELEAFASESFLGRFR